MITLYQIILGRGNMSNAEKSQEIAKQAGVAAKKAGKVIGAGLSKFSKKMAAGAKGFKEGLKNSEESPVESEIEYVSDESSDYEEVGEAQVEEGQEVKTKTVEADYSLDD